MIGGERQCVMVALYGRIRISLRLQGMGKVVMEYGIKAVQADRLAEAGNGFVQLLQRFENSTQVAMVNRRVRTGMQRKQDKVARQRMVPYLVGEHAKQVLRFRVVRIFMQRLLVCRIGLFQPAGLVVFESFLDQMICSRSGHCYGAALRSAA